MKILSKSTVSIMMVAAGLVVSTIAMAATGKVAGGPHDFSLSGGSQAYKNPSLTETQVCSYCHTPHNAGQKRLLWNKVGNSIVTFRLYTSSGTLTGTVRNNKIVGAQSLLCLSCHDGKTAINVLHAGGKGGDAASAGFAGENFAFGNTAILMPGAINNFFSVASSKAIGQYGTEATGAGTGDNLTDDHPLGFSYQAAYSDRVASGDRIDALIPPLQVNDASHANGAIRFFGTNGTLECSSCHDPHVNFNPAKGGDASLKPFLVMSNSVSKLCLSCHNK
jgi:hypothetical protein